MVVTPNSKIRLLKSSIELDERNQLTFANLTAQTNYFLSLTYLEEDDATYVRKDNVIRFPTDPTGTTYEDLLQYNYCMYQNTAYDSKWFYAFITGIKYINDGMSEITIETDVIETWKFDIVYKSSFIEREHTNDDTRGANLVPENLETGEYISQFITNYGLGTSHVVMATNVDPSDGTTPVSGGTYGNIYSGVSYYVFQTENDINVAIRKMAESGKVDAISSLFYCPDFITGYSTASFTNGIASVSSSQGTMTSISVPLAPSTIDGYTPKNNKLFTYPYVAFVLSNNSGGSMTYHLEDFKDNSTHLGEIKVRGTCTPGASIRAIPVNYRCQPTTLTDTDNNEYGLTMGKYPVCSYPADVYTNWVTQQGINPYMNMLESSIGGIASGSPLSVGTNLLASTYNAIHEVNLHNLVPYEARGNINSGDITYTLGNLGYTGYLQTIKSQFARIIDDFFSMYGYKTNRLKVPNIEGRTNWNYVKTIDINITGNIPQEDMQKIKDIFNNGITFWHNPTTFLDYSQSNTIVS